MTPAVDGVVWWLVQSAVGSEWGGRRGQGTAPSPLPLPFLGGQQLCLDNASTDTKLLGFSAEHSALHSD